VKLSLNKIKYMLEFKKVGLAKTLRYFRARHIMLKAEDAFRNEILHKKKKATNDRRQQQAVSSLQGLIKDYPDIAPKSVYLLLNQYYHSQGSFDQADAVIMQGYKNHPKDDKFRMHADVLQHALGLDWDALSTLRLIQYTRQMGDPNTGPKYPTGYQSITLSNIKFPGLRDPEARLGYIPIDFEGKSVLDIGCNQGGFLFALANRIRWGTGLDYDTRMINACNKISAYKSTGNLNFFVYDLTKEEHRLIPSFMPEPKVDVAFLLRIWSDNLSMLLSYLPNIAESVVFEPIKNHPNAVADLEILRSLYNHVEIIETDICDPYIKGTKDNTHTLYYAINNKQVHS
jgi:SAM-dependent methyltransferase